MKLIDIYKRFFREFWVEARIFFVILFGGLIASVALIFVIFIIALLTGIGWIKDLIIIPVLFWLATILFAVGRLIVFQWRSLIRDSKDIWKG